MLVVHILLLPTHLLRNFPCPKYVSHVFPRFARGLELITHAMSLVAAWEDPRNDEGRGLPEPHMIFGGHLDELTPEVTNNKLLKNSK